VSKLEDPSRKERRTLVLCHDPAFHPSSGADLRNHRNAVSAAAFGPVFLVSVRAQADRPLALAANIQTAALTIDGEARARSLGWWRTRTENRIPRPALTRLDALVRTFRPDTIVVEGIPLFKLLRPLRPLARQLILDMHNVESDLSGQLHSANGIRSRSAIVAAAVGIRRLERKALAIVDRVWVCSKQDRERLAALSGPKVPIDIVPNGIPRFEDIPLDLPAQTAPPTDFRSFSSSAILDTSQTSMPFSGLPATSCPASGKHCRPRNWSLQGAPPNRP
jgi:Glycosyl transferase 4-like domain